MPTNLFSNAKQAAKPAKAKKEKPVAQLNSAFAPKIKRYNELQSEIESLQSEKAVLEAELKNTGKQIFLDLYEKMKSKPDNFKMVSGLEKIMFILQDKYLKVDEEKLSALRQFFGITETEEKGVDKQKLDQFNSVLDSKSIYSFVPEVLERNIKAINDAIMNSKKISDEDKKNLLTVETEVSIKKGLINNLLQYPDFRQLFALIQPIAQLKGVGKDE